MGGIKNKHIIHYVRNGRYICIGAVKPTLVKSTRFKEKVKCKRCKYLLKKENRF